MTIRKADCTPEVWEKHLEYFRKYFKANAAAQRARCKAWREKNREKYNAIQRAGRQRRKAAKQESNANGKRNEEG